MKIYIGCDVGTSSTKAVAVDENGKVLAEGYRTGDIMAVGCTLVGCSKMGDLLAERI